MSISKFNIDYVWKNTVITKNLMRKTQTRVHKHVLVPITFIRERHINQYVSNIEDRELGTTVIMLIIHYTM